MHWGRKILIHDNLENIFINIRHTEEHNVGDYWELENVPFRVKSVENLTKDLFEYNLNLSENIFKNLSEIEEKVYDPKVRDNFIYIEAAYFAYKVHPILKSYAISPKFEGNFEEFIEILKCCPSSYALKKLSNERRGVMLAKYVELSNVKDINFLEDE